jgi:hypothetical protein
MTGAGTRPLWLRVLLIAAQIALAIVASYFLMWPLGMASDVLRLSYSNTWSLLHGGFGAVWPALAIFSFALLGSVKGFHRLHDAPLFAAGALLGLVMEGMMRAPEAPDFLTAPLSLLAVASVSSALLACFAKRWILLAVVIALPQWLEILFWMDRIPLFGWDGLEMLASALEQSLPLPMAALAGVALAKLADRFRRVNAVFGPQFSPSLGRDGVPGSRPPVKLEPCP